MQILIYLILWYTIGVGSMYFIQYWVAKQQLDEQYQNVYNITLLRNSEVWVLGICGLIVPAMILYTYMAVWYMTRKNK